LYILFTLGVPEASTSLDQISLDIFSATSTQLYLGAESDT